MTDLLIKTKRLILRNFKPDDWTAVHVYGCDPEVVQYQEWGPNSEEDTKRFIDLSIQSSTLDPRIDFELAIILAAENKLIGGAGIHISNAANREGWIGYCLNKQFWGQGFGTEAAQALLSFGFGDLKLHRIFATVFPGNVSSVNILKKIGMNKEGHSKSHKLVRGAWRDSDWYAVIESDYAKV